MVNFFHSYEFLILLGLEFLKEEDHDEKLDEMVENFEGSVTVAWKESSC